MIARIRRSDLLHHGAIVFGGVVAANAFNYLFYMLVGRLAGVVVYGEVTALVSALLVVGAPANVGQLILAKLAADLEAAGDRAALRRLANLVAIWALFVGLLVVLAVFVERDRIATFFKLGDAAPVVAAGFTLAVFFVTCLQRGVLQGAHLFEQYATTLAFEGVARVVLGVVLVTRFGAAGAVAGVGLGIALAGAYNVSIFRRSFGSKSARITLDGPALKRIVTGVGLGQVTLTVLTYYDVSLVKHVFDARSAGLYAAAALVGRAVIAAAAFIPTIVLPKAAARVAAGRSTLPLLGTAMGLAAAFAAIAALFSFFVPSLVVRAVAGGAFEGAAGLVLPYVLASSALSLATVVASYNFGLHRYVFVGPVLVAACAEIVALSLWHPSLRAVVGVLLVGHVCVLMASLNGVWSPLTRTRATEANEPLAGSEATLV